MDFLLRLQYKGTICFDYSGVARGDDEAQPVLKMQALRNHGSEVAPKILC
jgi:hypothetical protein